MARTTSCDPKILVQKVQTLKLIKTTLVNNSTLTFIEN